MAGKTYTCARCQKTMAENNFFTYKDGTKTELCKKCLTAHIDNFNPDTFLWLLEKMDVPYIPQEWNVLRDDAFQKKGNKMDGMSVFGKYLSKMRLNQWNKFHWADTERLMAEDEEKRKLAEIQQKEYEERVQKEFEEGTISEAEYKTFMSAQTRNEKEKYVFSEDEVDRDHNFYNEDVFMKEEDLIDPAAELTQEDKLFLAMKWGRLYKPSQWVELEKKYKEMSNSFDIQDSDTEGTLILICKTYLKMNEAIDIGDMDGYQKLSRVYDSLRKSAKFTAAQNKDEKGDFVDSVGELVAYCEKVGGQIPRYDISVDYDIVDKVIKDLKEYTKSLVYEDTSLARQIEDYIKKKENAETMKKDREEAKAKGLDEVQIEDQDYQEYFQNIEKDKKEDQEVYYEKEEKDK